MKSKLKYIAAILLISVFATSCLKHDLPSLPSYTDADITDIYSEYRYYDTAKSTDGNQIVRIQTLSVSNKQFGKEDVSATVTVPPASDFQMQSEWAKVAATNIVVMCNVTTAASITPVDGAPRLGSPGDYSKPQTYMVTAADGKTQKKWTIKISLVK